ncbi:MAG: prolipoprotein diacylglyceryl transferase [Bacilli bacterium]|jgi:phosphatidylglycerol:prolipoprotein diacylglycerol transferase|nr:prolipoprotein diacylglyceryl transferase [Bacilli bacterium]
MNGINALIEWFGFDTAGGKYFTVFGIKITFYALCLLSGGLIALYLSNYRAHKKGMPMDVFSTVFLWAFPGGVVGARIWYVIATWPGANGEYANDFLAVFRTWEGGLAIQGGAIGGALVGLLVVIFRRKGWDLFEAADCAGPTILIGQVIGRWGNFVNQEVYGQIVDVSAWGGLPSFINQRMMIGGSYRVPLFFLEAMINLGGYFFLTRFVPLVFSRHYRKGDQMFLYFSWYGFVRVLLEPLRDKQFNMGAETTGNIKDMQAVIMGIIFIVAGVLAVVANHLVRDIKEKKAGVKSL